MAVDLVVPPIHWVEVLKKAFSHIKIVVDIVGERKIRYVVRF